MTTFLRACAFLCAVAVLPASIGGQAQQGPPGRLDDYNACLASDADACFRVGNSYIPYLDEQPGDFTRAAHFFLKGCDAGHVASCDRVAEMFRLGQGVPRDPIRSAYFLALAAELRRQRR